MSENRESTFSIVKLEVQIEEIKDKRAMYKPSTGLNPGLVLLLVGIVLAVIFDFTLGSVLVVSGAVWAWLAGKSRSASNKAILELDGMLKARRNLILRMKEEGLETISREDLDREEKKLIG
jgi:hypothetical protein